MRDNGPNIYVSAGHIAIFADGVNEGFKDDALSSSLYFQLAASNKHSRFDEFNQWRDVYLEAMTSFGWLPTARGTRDYAAEEKQSFDVWSQMKASLAGRVSTTLLDQFEQWLAGLEAAAQVSAALALFRECAVSLPWRTPEGTTEDVEAVPQERDVEEVSISLLLSFISREPLMTSVFLTLKTTESMDNNLLSQRFVPEKVVGNLEIDVILSEIIEHKYRTVRDRLNATLGERKQTLIMGVNGVSP